MTGVCCSTNKDTVLEAFEMLFNKRDYKSAESFWSPDYIQHSAYIPGVAVGSLISSSRFQRRFGTKTLWLRLKATMSFCMDAFPATHWQEIGSSQILCDCRNGVLVEHWDVIQNEATEAESKSGRPMFGLTFPPTARPSAVTPNV